MHKWSTGFSSGACDGHSALPAPTYSTRPMGGGAHAVRGHTSGQRLAGARPCQPTHRNQGNARRAHAAAFEGTLAALAALTSRAGGAVVRRRAYSTRLNARRWYQCQCTLQTKMCTSTTVLRCRWFILLRSSRGRFKATRWFSKIAKKMAKRTK